MRDFETGSVVGGVVILGMLLFGHFNRYIATEYPGYRFVVFSLMIGGILYLAGAALMNIPLGLFIASFYTIAFGVCVFILISEALLRGGAHKLNEWMGNKWIKRIDYVYLILGAIGAVISINRLSAVQNKVAGLDTLGPMLVIGAIAIRIIKTRAELNDWDKL